MSPINGTISRVYSLHKVQSFRASANHANSPRVVLLFERLPASDVAINSPYWENEPFALNHHHLELLPVDLALSTMAQQHTQQPWYWTARRPDMTTQPRAWEKSWEDDFRCNYSALEAYSGTVLELLRQYMPVHVMLASSATDTGQMVHAEEQAQLCRMQRALAVNAGFQFIHDDFERKWREMSAARREEVVLEGICRAMKRVDMQARRWWCPETTLTNLTADGGEEYLRLFRSLTPDSVDEDSVEPIHVPHPLLDPLFVDRVDEQIPGNRALCRRFRTWRTMALTHVVSCIFSVAVSSLV